MRCGRGKRLMVVDSCVDMQESEECGDQAGAASTAVMWSIVGSFNGGRIRQAGNLFSVGPPHEGRQVAKPGTQRSWWVPSAC